MKVDRSPSHDPLCLLLCNHGGCKSEPLAPIQKTLLQTHFISQPACSRTAEKSGTNQEDHSQTAIQQPPTAVTKTLLI